MKYTVRLEKRTIYDMVVYANDSFEAQQEALRKAEDKNTNKFELVEQFTEWDWIDCDEFQNEEIDL